MVDGWPAKGPSGTSSGSLLEMASVPEMRAVLEELQVGPDAGAQPYHEKNRISD
eukprot:COSAG01_NODE_23641_length_807_cov_1.141243_1_plen_54_part_00